MDAAMKPPWMGLRRPQQGYSDSIVRVSNLLLRSVFCNTSLTGYGKLCWLATDQIKRLK